MDDRPAPPYRIAPARLPDDLPIIRQLFTDYVKALGEDLSFQGFAEELAGLPGKYAAPQGTILLARGPGPDAGSGSEAAPGPVLGCIALRPLPETCGPGLCEMKRLYVLPAGRGLGVGQALVSALLAAAATRGYRAMWLDTLEKLQAARALYEKAGFTPIPPYSAALLPGMLFLGRDLP